MASHPNNAEIEIKGGYTLSMVILPFLDGADDWLDFSDGIETFLIMNNQLEWLESHQTRPSGGSGRKGMEKTSQIRHIYNSGQIELQRLTDDWGS